MPLVAGATLSVAQKVGQVPNVESKTGFCYPVLNEAHLTAMIAAVVTLFGVPINLAATTPLMASTELCALYAADAQSGAGHDPNVLVVECTEETNHVANGTARFVLLDVQDKRPLRLYTSRLVKRGFARELVKTVVGDTEVGWFWVRHDCTAEDVAALLDELSVAYEFGEM